MPTRRKCRTHRQVNCSTCARNYGSPSSTTDMSSYWLYDVYDSGSSFGGGSSYDSGSSGSFESGGSASYDSGSSGGGGGFD